MTLSSLPQSLPHVFPHPISLLPGEGMSSRRRRKAMVSAKGGRSDGEGRACKGGLVRGRRKEKGVDANVHQGRENQSTGRSPISTGCRGSPSGLEADIGHSA
eukprot:213594-Rhodomonas_salina.1